MFEARESSRRASAAPGSGGPLDGLRDEGRGRLRASERRARRHPRPRRRGNRRRRLRRDGRRMAVVAPMATGMGGDAFLLFYEAGTGRVLGANGSGRAPKAATIEKLRDRGIDEMPERGGLTVTVPGAVRLWEDAANALGNLPLARLLEPAWELAEDGYPVSEVVARYWEERGGPAPQERGRGDGASCRKAGRPAPGRSSPRRTSPARSPPSPRAGPTPSTTARSRGASRAPCRRQAGTWPRRTSRPTRPRGSSRSPPTTGASGSTRYRRRARASRPWRC